MAKKKVSKKTPSKKTGKAPAETVLVLRTCAADMTAHGGFIWPESGPVECSDWDPAPRCGGGLHGCLWGEGCGDLLSWNDNARWLVVEVDASTIVELDGKVKFPRGTVVHCGTRLSATEFIQRPGRAVIGGTATAGSRGTATAGDEGTATAGDAGIVVVRYYDGMRYRLAVGYVGEDGIEANAQYVVSEGKLVKKAET